MLYCVTARKLDSEDLEFICESSLDDDFFFSSAFRELFARLIKEGYTVFFKECTL